MYPKDMIRKHGHKLCQGFVMEGNHAPCSLICAHAHFAAGRFLRASSEEYHLCACQRLSRSVGAHMQSTLLACAGTCPEQVRYEVLGELLRSAAIRRQLAASVALNWLVGPLLMTGLAWATLPDLPSYRNGDSFTMENFRVFGFPKNIIQHLGPKCTEKQCLTTPRHCRLLFAQRSTTNRPMMHLSILPLLPLVPQA